MLLWCPSSPFRPQPLPTLALFAGSCIVVPHGLLPGPVSLAGDSNPQPTLDECALSCLGAPKCLGEGSHSCQAALRR